METSNVPELEEVIPQNEFNPTNLLLKLRSTLRPQKPDPENRAPLPRTTPKRLQKSLQSESLDGDQRLSKRVLGEGLAGLDADQTVLYLAYGSNLSIETFRRRRGIRPLSQVNVYVPQLKLTFDLPGVPYQEPCFAGSHYRETDQQPKDNLHRDEKSDLFSERAPLIGRRDYHKDRWHKPMIAVVYEVTLEDYAHIIATEGGGSSYQDKIVTCYPFPADYNPSDPVPDHPTTTAFKAHTLLSPSQRDKENSDDENTGDKNGRRRGARNRNPAFQRPDPSYAQPSARYLNLLKQGAAELQLPIAYRKYLASIRPFRKTTLRQHIGAVIFLSLWGPFLLFIITLGSLLANKDGRIPQWVAKVQHTLFRFMWASYDSFFRKVFGEGERTYGDI